MKTLQHIQDVIQNRHQYAKDWKSRNTGKVVGYFCTYMPEELIYAAKALPVRIFCSSEPQTITDVYSSRSKWCSFCRDCLAAGLSGDYDYLDGLTIASNCFHNLQSFGNWTRYKSVSFQHYLYFPSHIQGKPAGDCLTNELMEFKQTLEKWTSESIGIDALDKAIDIYNNNRRLMKSIYELRKNDPPLISGSEAMEMVVSGQIMDKAEHNAILEKLIPELQSSPDRLKKGIRLMAIGAGNDDTKLIRKIESWGASVVIDDHCAGSRYFWNEVIPETDGLRSIANRYIQRPPCPIKDYPERRRIPHILDMAREFDVKGAVLIQQKRCEPHEYDMPAIESKLNQSKIPTLILEVDNDTSFEQIRTRVEAFLEMIRMESW